MVRIVWLAPDPDKTGRVTVAAMSLFGLYTRHTYVNVGVPAAGVRFTMPMKVRVVLSLTVMT